MKDDELKPCPFCGQTAGLDEKDNYIYCRGCGAAGPDDWEYAEKHREMWNERKGGE